SSLVPGKGFVTHCHSSLSSAGGGHVSAPARMDEAGEVELGFPRRILHNEGVREYIDGGIVVETGDKAAV
ncbi:MAG: hypothetical protein KAJ19_26785, partial [Gammaproteobacteria bacterium]|nr:hypothetical protein [Gammaproteobacteria bacterium]